MMHFEDNYAEKCELVVCALYSVPGGHPPAAAAATIVSPSMAPATSVMKDEVVNNIAPGGQPPIRRWLLSSGQEMEEKHPLRLLDIESPVSQQTYRPSPVTTDDPKPIKDNDDNASVNTDGYLSVHLDLKVVVSISVVVAVVLPGSVAISVYCCKKCFCKPKGKHGTNSVPGEHVAFPPTTV